MHKADRLFQLVNLIRVHQPITAERLAERIGVSVRSIYRYIDDLSLSGVPVYGTTGVGYALDAGFEMPPLRLSRIEVDALMLGMEMLAGNADNELAGAARTLLSKVSASSPQQAVDPQQSPIRALGTTSVTTRGHLSTLRQAIEHKRVLQITYTSLDGEVSRRTIQPIGLFYWGGKWTVGSWCNTRAAYRDFRVDRIASIFTSDEPWRDSPHIALRTYMRHQSGNGRTDSTLSGWPLHTGASSHPGKSRMPHPDHVLELAIFTVKPEYIAQMPELRDGLREALKSFPGLIAYRGYCPMADQRTFVDIAEWQTYEHAADVARAFNEGDPRFSAYMAAIESLSFMNHFVPEFTQ